MDYIAEERENDHHTHAVPAGDEYPLLLDHEIQIDLLRQAASVTGRHWHFVRAVAMAHA